jgi:prevent-host-death family protein
MLKLNWGDMTTTYTFSKARQNLASLLEQAARDGEARIVQKNGQVFVIRPADYSKSPLDVRGIDLDVSADDIVRIVREGREQRTYLTGSDDLGRKD